jgi:c-di-GMP-binding flagellar brake protein YcgR
MWVDEARERSRLRRSVHLDCEAVAESGFRLLGRTAIDLSETGMLVCSAEDVGLGERVFVSFRAPRGQSFVDAEAEVVRLVEGHRRSDPVRAVGLRFRRMDAIDRAILAGSLVRIPPPVPARHLRRDYARFIQRTAVRYW